MEIETLIYALQETISCLRTSKVVDSSQMPVEEIVRRLEVEIAKARNGKVMDVNFLDRLFAPTSVLQKISIDNGWGTKFLRLSEVVDRFIAS